MKFNCVKEGYYRRENDEIILNFFEEEADFKIAEEAISENLGLLQSLGSKINPIFRFFFTLITKVTYEQSQVKRYLKH